MNGEPSRISVSVVGAGLAGLTAARHLQVAGCQVHVFDKARGPGGRMSTRREAGCEFDHGAQYFTVENEAFRQAVDRWQERGVVARWQGRIVRVGNGEIRSVDQPSESFVGVPGMNALCHDLSDSLTITFHTLVSEVVPSKGVWNLRSEDGRDLGRFDRVIVTTPPAQAVPLLAGAPGLAKRASSAEMLPCWAVMLAFDRGIEIEWDAAFVFESPLSWVARNTSKPGRPPGESWVLHGSPEWSATHIEIDPLQVADELTTAFFEAARTPRLEAVARSVHRWRYARTQKPLLAQHLYDPELGVGVCGDWCRGDRVEDAFLSGLSLAKEITAAPP